MKRKALKFISLMVLLCLLLSSCGASSNVSESASEDIRDRTIPAGIPESEDATTDLEVDLSLLSDDTPEPDVNEMIVAGEIPEDEENEAPEKASLSGPTADVPERVPFVVNQQEVQNNIAIPSYQEAGKAYSVINSGIPYFTQEDLSTDSFLILSPFDDLGRTGQAYANLHESTMPTESRGSLAGISPSGWHTIAYNDLIEDRYLFNRCHLIGFQFVGNNDPENLITGTRYLNVEGMKPFENKVASYLKGTSNHVLYRVTPIYSGSNLVADGVLMEALSVEDGGEGVSFNVFVYNVQPHIEIDYETGESSIGELVNTAELLISEALIAGGVGKLIEIVDSAPVETAIAIEANSDDANSNESPEPVVEEPQENAPASTEDSASKVRRVAHKGDPPDSDITYVLNKNSKKVHCADCRSVKQINVGNRLDTTYTLEEIRELYPSYEPCKNCYPWFE